MEGNLGTHEALELHELITFKSLCVTKASIMQLLVSDEELKTIMQQDVEISSKHIEALKNYLS
ncbi:hypothetical protein AB3U99_21005 [Niallia sp. JL1B1071]|uniref:hypothetical protein n=1 Tax=Niallia tiangongensis TaxID=3237105 RepID=UPI0037DCDCCD